MIIASINRKFMRQVVFVRSIDGDAVALERKRTGRAQPVDGNRAEFVTFRGGAPRLHKSRRSSVRPSWMVARSAFRQPAP